MIPVVIPVEPRSGDEPGRRALPVCPPGQPVRAEPGATRCGPDLSPGQARCAFRAGGGGCCAVPDSRCAASGMTRCRSCLYAAFALRGFFGTTSAAVTR